MSEQDGAQSTTKQRRRRKTNNANQQNGKQTLALLRPSNEDTEAWKAYWKAQGQSWRTEVEIDTERQRYLSERRSITPDMKLGIYPFKDIKLSRADVEWLLATHEDGRGPVDWSDEKQRERKGLDLRGADLRKENLSKLPLARLLGGGGHRWRITSDIDISIIMEFRSKIEEKGFPEGLHLEGADLGDAHLESANLDTARLEKTDLSDAHLEGACLVRTHLEGACLFQAHLAGARLYNAYLKEAQLEKVILSDEKQIGPQLANVHWDGVNLTVVNWAHVEILGDEYMARKKRHDGRVRDKATRLEEYEVAVQAYRQLATVLRNQGLNEDAARFAYRAQLMQRLVFRQQRKISQYLFSLFLDLLTGYGYKPIRSFISYAVVISVFAFIYFLLGSHLAWNEAIVISMTAFHGRGFFPEQFKPGDPQAFVAALEAFVGLLVEVTFIATLTQRLFGK